MSGSRIFFIILVGGLFSCFGFRFSINVSGKMTERFVPHHNFDKGRKLAVTEVGRAFAAFRKGIGVSGAYESSAALAARGEDAADNPYLHATPRVFGPKPGLYGLSMGAAIEDYSETGQAAAWGF